MDQGSALPSLFSLMIVPCLEATFTYLPLLVLGLCLSLAGYIEVDVLGNPFVQQEPEFCCLWLSPHIV